MRLAELRYHGDDADFHNFLTRLPYRVPLLAGGSLTPRDAGYPDVLLHYICWGSAWKFWIERVVSPTPDS